MVSITDLFKPEELKEKNDGNFKVECPDCGLQGGREPGLILFPENSGWHCHSSGKHGSFLEMAAIKAGIIKCVECNDSGEKERVLEGDLFIETLGHIQEDYGDDFFEEMKEQFNIFYIEDFLIKEYDKKGKVKSTKVNIDKVSEHIIKKHDIKTIYGLKEESIYTYDNGIWERKGKGLIKSEVEKLLKVYAKNNVVCEILEKIKRMTETTREEFDKVPIFKRCFINGVLDIENVDNIKFLPHSKDYNFKTKFPLVYNPEAKCPKIKKFIEDTFYPDDIQQVEEWIGNHLPKKVEKKKAVIIHGPKNTGKTVFLNLLTCFIGEKNIVDHSLQKISIGKSFDLLFLKDKYANIHDDLSPKDLNDGGGFKMAVGDGYISGEEKFGDHHRFKNTAKMTFACNKIPSVKEIDDDAYYDRWMIWTLDNVLPKEEMVDGLIDQLSTEEELSGLLNIALEGYYRLKKQNYFSNVKNSEEIKSMMIRNSNPLAEFVSKHLIQENGNTITKDKMYELYCKFCMDEKPKLSPSSKNQLGKQLNRFAPYALSKSNGKIRFWLNVKFNNDVQEMGNEKNNDVQEMGESEENKTDLSVKLTDMTVPKILCATIDKKKDNGMKNKQRNILLPVISVSKTQLNKTPKSDREIQFFEAEECKNINPNHTIKDVRDYIKTNPKYTPDDLYKKFGVGCFKFEGELKKDGKIK